MDVNEKIIEAVEKYDCLYNLQSNNYKNCQLKEDIWKKISEEIGIDAKEVKKKWRNIRDAYRKAKQKENVPSGSEAVFHKPYKYCESLRFLDDVAQTRITTGNVDDDSIDTVEVASDADESNQQLTKRKRTISSMQEKMENFLESASASIKKLSESKPSSTSQLFESLATKINEANLTTSEIYEVESAVCSLVYSKLSEYSRNKN